MFASLDPSTSILLIVCLLAACAFEFINGFHDTANAVATVIYTNSLKPRIAVIWSGIFNFLGVMSGGIAVAVGIINILPVEALVDQNLNNSLSMIMAILATAISWNLLTWYYGIPCSSSHTLVGSILGVGIAFYLLPGSTDVAVNWTKAGDIGLALLLSPLFGFSASILLMYLFKRMSKGDKLFKEPHKNTPPPKGIRALLILTCTGVSFFHGSNDGQKGVGLAMLILIGIVPAYFALNSDLDLAQLRKPVANITSVIDGIEPDQIGAEDRVKLAETKLYCHELDSIFRRSATTLDIAESQRFGVRKDIIMIDKNMKHLTKRYPELFTSNASLAVKQNLSDVKELTDYSPVWVLLMISISLGVGTMVGWKRIVVTIGEKIGKQHMTYAQGASAELVAASTIGISTAFGLPVSTTHVLSSGVAGSMVASKGVKNLNAGTIKTIALAWVLTLPVVVFMSATLFLIFRYLANFL